MPNYRFVGAFERVLHGLSYGVNAELVGADPDTAAEHPLESTVVARPGDEITTTEPYPHAEMVNTDTGTPDAPPAEDLAEPGEDAAAGFEQVAAAGAGAAAAVAVLRTAARTAQQGPAEGPDEQDMPGEQAGTDPTTTTEGA